MISAATHLQGMSLSNVPSVVDNPHSSSAHSCKAVRIVGLGLGEFSATLCTNSLYVLAGRDV
eukprot:5785363-Prymnesium_polylepis.1